MKQREISELKTPVSRYLSRDLSWVDFNERVLEEGLRPELLPLDRYKYLSIVSSNFDEFFMVRIAAIKRALQNTAIGNPEPHLADELKIITKKIRSILERQYAALVNDVLPELSRRGLSLLRPKNWTEPQKEYLESLFLREILPILTPLRVEDEEPLPAIENLWIHAAFLLEAEGDGHEEKFSVVRLPQVLDRIITLFPEAQNGEAETLSWVLLEDLVLAFGHHAYPGYKIREQLLFKINRDADFSVDEQRDEDFIEAMEEVLEGRERSMVVRMSYVRGSVRLRDYFASRFGLGEDDLYEIDGPLNLGNLYDLARIPGFDRLREKPWKIYPHPAFPEDAPIWDRLREGDVVLHLPYQGFEPVIRFFRDAAVDPNVVAIKTTLYRTSEDSPIVRALELAGLSGKHVTAVVELKARFDEKQNISWANRLEKAGVIVVYGIANLKIHAKASVVIRRESGRLRRYLHFSTGNYNEKTAKTYEDISLFTANEELAYDTGLLFNLITGYSATQPMRRLIAAPMSLKKKLLYLVDREISHSSPESPGKIMAKMNALADRDIIEALYRASGAGVEILLNIRGICLLIPGVPGMSENIKVIGIIDYYLEHSRLVYFANGGAEELYLSSADWMPRNLERRIELLVPILREDAKAQILESLKSYFRDNTNAWQLDSRGVWSRVKAGGAKFRSQTNFLSMAEKAAHIKSEDTTGTIDTGFIVRRSPPNTPPK